MLTHPTRNPDDYFFSILAVFLLPIRSIPLASVNIFSGCLVIVFPLLSCLYLIYISASLLHSQQCNVNMSEKCRGTY